MKKILIALFLFVCNAAFAQVALIGESGDGKTVKLLWFFKTWDKSIRGFDVKRKAANGNWQKLNATLIVPEISLKKSLTNVEPNAFENNRLRIKLQTLMTQKKLKPLSSTAFLQRLATDTNATKALAITLALDYDVALISGFALVDRSAAAGNTYQYGLFPVKNNATENNPAATFSWTYGAVAKLTPPLQIEAQPYARNKTIELEWYIQEKLQDMYVAGYNIYKQIGTTWKKINVAPVPGANHQTAYTYFDNTSPATQNITYAFAMQSIFGNEGNKVKYVYNAADHPLAYKAPQLTDITSTGNSFSINWNFPKESEKLLKGFIVAKANLPSDFKNVSDLLPASQRTFVDKSFSPPASYVQFRVHAVYNDDEEIKSKEQLTFYLPTVALSKPTNLKGQWVKENDKTFIDLSWDAKAPTDSLTQSYQLYATDPADGKIYLQASLPKITTNHFRYEIFNTKAATYQFKIVPVSKYNTEGTASEILTVNAPATILAMPDIETYSIDDSDRVTLQWKYEDMNSIKGYRLFQNGNQIAGENELKKDAQRFTTTSLKEDEKYLFTLQAIGENGIESPMSYPLNVLVYQKTKR